MTLAGCRLKEVGRRIVWSAAFAALGLTAHLVGQQRVIQPGDPLPGLTPVEFEEFRLGLEDFLEVETSEEGLGPAFNGTSCGVVPQRAGRWRCGHGGGNRAPAGGRPAASSNRWIRQASRSFICSRCRATPVSRRSPSRPT